MAVVGAGPVGLLTALALSRRGFRKAKGGASAFAPGTMKNKGGGRWCWSEADFGGSS